MKTNQWDILADFEIPRIESYDLGLVVYSVREYNSGEYSRRKISSNCSVGRIKKKASIKHKNVHNLFWANELCW